MNIQQIKSQISLSYYLKEQGYLPARKVGIQLAYHSPFRKEEDPSFFVNDQKGVWYDHGEGKGGTVIDLAMQLHNLSLSEVIRHFNRGNFSKGRKEDATDEIKKEIATVEVLQVQALGKNQALTDYLESRGIYQEAIKSGILKEVYYKININDAEKRYFGVGWQNEASGWEVSSKYSKICLLGKGISKTFKSALNPNIGKIAVFESMFDYLSALKLDWVKEHDHVIVLNSTALVSAFRKELGKYTSLREINCYFDNDKSGDIATKMLELFASKNNIQFRDMRSSYKEVKDINEHLSIRNYSVGYGR